MYTEKENINKQSEVTDHQPNKLSFAVNPPSFQLKANSSINKTIQTKKKEDSLDNSIVGLSALNYESFNDHLPSDSLVDQELNQATPPVFQLKSSSSYGLPDETLNKMSGSFGTDFSDVNIHSDSKSALILGALAYTQGNDIHFAPGQYDPASGSGQELLGHELTHVQQQREGRVIANNEVNGMPLNDDKGLEVEADVMGAKAAQMKVDKTSSVFIGDEHGKFQSNLNAAQLLKNPAKSMGLSVAAHTMQFQISPDKAKSDGAGYVNTGGNVVGGVTAAFEELEAAKKLKELEAIQQAALAKKAAAARAVKAAGSGKSASKSAKASKAVRAANAAAKDASKAKQAASTVSSSIKTGSRIAKIVDKLPLDAIGAIASFASKLYSSDNTTTTGKVVDAGATSALDTAFSMANPITAGIDALIGLIPGGERYNISNTMSNSTSAITGAGESILTGDTRGIESFHQKSLAGENTWIFQKAAEWGESYKGREGVSERVERTGDFWGGADSTTGRAGAFAASLPGFGEVGEGIGHGLGWAATEGIELWGDVFEAGGDAVDYIEDNFTLDPSEIEWDPREWF